MTTGRTIGVIGAGTMSLPVRLTMDSTARVRDIMTTRIHSVAPETRVLGVRSIVRFVAVVAAALLSGCTVNVYLTDQVIHGTVTQQTKGASEKSSAVADDPKPAPNHERQLHDNDHEGRGSPRVQAAAGDQRGATVSVKPEVKK